MTNKEPIILKFSKKSINTHAQELRLPQNAGILTMKRGNDPSCRKRMPARWIFLQTETKQELLKEFNIAVTETINRKVGAMCDLSAGIYDRGKQEGKEEIAYGSYGRSSCLRQKHEAAADPEAFLRSERSF